jgi:hypothetical protein
LFADFINLLARTIMPFFFELKHLLALLFFACSVAVAKEQTPLTLDAATQKVVQDNPNLAQMLSKAACPIRKSVSMP